MTGIIRPKDEVVISVSSTERTEVRVHLDAGDEGNE
jgi:hypothetical protein